MITMHLFDRPATTDPALAEFFLARLASLVARQAAATNRRERLLLGKVAFSVYRDCLELGLAAEANAIARPARETARAA